MNFDSRMLNKLIVNIHCVHYAPMDIIVLNSFTERLTRHRVHFLPILYIMYITKRRVA